MTLIFCPNPIGFGYVSLPILLLIRIFGGDLQMYKDFLAECKQGFQEDDNDLLPIKMIDSKDGGKWTQVALRSKRPIASVITSNNIAEDVAKDMREFLDSESWYTNRGIPWRRGYLLYGK